MEVLYLVGSKSGIEGEAFELLDNDCVGVPISVTVVIVDMSVVSEEVRSKRYVCETLASTSSYLFQPAPCRDAVSLRVDHRQLQRLKQ